MIPVHNERQALPLLWARLGHVRATALSAYNVQVLFVDDGSDDGSGPWLRALARTEAQVCLVELDRAYGHQQALCAGLHTATGEAVITLDADLQDPPEYIAAMLAHWLSGADVVYGVRDGRIGDSLVKRLCAAVFYRVLNALSGDVLHNDCGDFRLLDRRCIAALEVLPAQPYVRGMVAALGGRQVALRYSRGPRCAGVSHYAWPKMARLAWAGCVGFARPMRLAACVAQALGLMAVTGRGLGCGLPMGLVFVAGAASLLSGAGLAWARRRAQRGGQSCYRIARVIAGAPPKSTLSSEAAWLAPTLQPGACAPPAARSIAGARSPPMHCGP